MLHHGHSGPVLILTIRSRLDERVRGLDLGAGRLAFERGETSIDYQTSSS